MKKSFDRPFAFPKGDITFSSVISRENSILSRSIRWELFLTPILLFGCTAGSLFSFLSAYQLRFQAFPLWITLIISALLLGISYQIPKIKWFILPFSAIILAFFCFFFRGTLTKGIESCGYQIFSVLKSSGYVSENPFFQTATLLGNTLLICTLAVLFTAITGFFLCALPCAPMVFLLTIPFHILVFCFQLTPSFWSVLLYFTAVAGFLVCRGFYQKTVPEFQDRHSGIRSSLGGVSPAVLTVCLYFVLFVGFSQIVWNVFSLEHPESFDRYAKQIREYDYAKFFNDLLFNPFPIGKGEGIISRGNLEYDYRTDLIVKMPYPNSNVYLRGFTGSIYKDGRWKELPDEAYQENWYERLKEYDLPYLNLYARDRESTFLLMEVESVDCGTKYAYTPEYAVEGADLRAEYDHSFRPNGSKYTIAYLSNNFRENIDGLRTASYLLPEEGYELLDEYQRFAYSNYQGHYLDGLETIEQEILKNLEQSMMDDVDWNNIDTYAYDLVEQVVLYLQKNYQYTRTPGETPKGKDPISYFLLENKKGYCVHFASAAAILLQDMGVPCRYVEGYVIRTEDLFNAKTESDTLKGEYKDFNDDSLQTVKKEYTLTTDFLVAELNDSSSHAWIEYCINGAWNRMEVTPSYDETSVFEQETLSTDTSSNPETSQDLTESSQEVQSQTTAEEAVSSVKEAANSEVSSRFYLLFIIVPGIFILLSGTLILRKIILEQRRKKLFASSDRKAAVLAQYQYIVKLLTQKGYHDAGNLCYHPKEWETFEPDIESSDCQKAMEIVLKALFSKNSISEKEYQLFTDFTQRIIQQQKQNR